MENFRDPSYTTFFLIAISSFFCFLAFIYYRQVDSRIKVVSDLLSKETSGVNNNDVALVNTSENDESGENGNEKKSERPTDGLAVTEKAHSKLINFTTETSDIYYNILFSVLDHASQSITVLNYLDNRLSLANNIENSNHVIESFDNYLLNIENKIKSSPALKYIRILQLPHYFNDKTSELKNEEVVALALISTFPAIRQHINNLMDYDNFELYVAKHPFRVHSEIIIDEEYWVNELDEYSTNGCMPDLLFINRCTESQLMADAIISEKNKLTNFITKLTRVTKDNITDSLNANIENLHKEVEIVNANIINVPSEKSGSGTTVVKTAKLKGSSIKGSGRPASHQSVFQSKNSNALRFGYKPNNFVLTTGLGRIGKREYLKQLQKAILHSQNVFSEFSSDSEGEL